MEEIRVQAQAEAARRGRGGPPPEVLTAYDLLCIEVKRAAEADSAPPPDAATATRDAAAAAAEFCGAVQCAVVAPG